MRSDTPSSPARRSRRLAARRARRRPVIVVAGLALAALTTAGITAAAPVPEATASSSSGGFVLASATSPIAVTPDAAPAADTTAADATLDAAEATLASAASVSTDIQSSGLDIGVPDISIDTATLQAAVQRLDNLDGSLQPFAPAAADQVAALVAPVDARVGELRSALDAAVQRKAEEEAAEKARAEAAAAEAAAAAAQAAKSAASSAPATGSRPAASISGGSAGEAQAIARDMVASRGWGDDQFGCLVALWNRESGWNYAAANPSGAYGIPQALPGSKMASAGGDWQTNPATQITWGLGYISGRYGTPCGAWDHSESAGWY